MKKVSVKCLICIAVLALTVANPAESRFAPSLTTIAIAGDLVIVGKLLAAEGKVDPQTDIMYTDVIVEVVKVIRNVTDQKVKVGSTINFRQIGGEIGDRKMELVGEAEFRKEEIGNLLLLSLKRPRTRATPWGRRGFDTIFDVFGGEYGKYTIKIKENIPMVHLFWLERHGEEVGLPLDMVNELMNMAITVASKNPVKKPKTPEEIPAEIRFMFRRLKNLERLIRQLAMDGLPEAIIIAMSRAEIAQVKQELDL